MSSNQYHVTWEIDVWADTPLDAAIEALQAQKSCGLATVFDVTDSAGETKRIDLTAEEQAGNIQLCDDCGAKCEKIIGCPDGAEICQECFDAGHH